MLDWLAKYKPQHYLNLVEHSGLNTFFLVQVYVYDLNVNKYEPLCEQSGKNVGLVSYRPR